MTHLVLLIHGVNGYATDLEYIQERIKSVSNTIVEAPTCNQGYTHSGIQAGAERYFNWLKNYCTINDIQELSILGHSLGGLYARYLVGLLFKEEWIPLKLKPKYFICLSTPHLPIRYYDRFFPKAVSSVVARWLIGKSGAEMLMIDTHKNTFSIADRFRKSGTSGRDMDVPTVPLLVKLCDTEFIQGLASFEKLVCYANIRHDPVVNYANAALSRFDYCNKQAYLQFKNVDLPHIFLHKDPIDLEFVPEDVDEELLIRLGSLAWTRYGIIPSRPILAHADMVIKFKYSKFILGSIVNDTGTRSLTILLCCFIQNRPLCCQWIPIAPYSSTYNINFFMIVYDVVST